ncbi:unnamed protein product [Soboliphyme baturini]|uniref:Uncharacterized protein n=1 Tax=Soboliphyme baturini TaxID=241478 RepID=A0A183J9V7_9BILA|nr:unnamed protein product [Soboliphyme baturini]
MLCVRRYGGECRSVLQSHGGNGQEKRDATRPDGLHEAIALKRTGAQPRQQEFGKSQRSAASVACLLLCASCGQTAPISSTNNSLAKCTRRTDAATRRLITTICDIGLGRTPPRSTDSERRTPK